VTGDTKIPLLDGRTLTIKEIYEEYGTDKEFWVYSVDTKGDFVPGRATCKGVTGALSQLTEVTLDSGKTVRCTPEHKFMLRDGSYREAKDLQIDDSLMPLYFRVQNPNSRYSQKYLQVKQNSKKKYSWKMVHRVVAGKVYEAKMVELLKELVEAGFEKGLAVHHKDFNGLNNVPSNLDWQGILQHWYYHAKDVDRTNCVAATKQRAKDNPEWSRAKSRLGGLACQKKHPDIWKKANEIIIAWTRSAEGHKIIRKNNLDMWATKRDLIVARMQGSQSKESCISSATRKRKWWKKNSQRRRDMVAHGSTLAKTKDQGNDGYPVRAKIGKVFTIFTRLRNEGKEITEQNFEHYRAKNGLRLLTVFPSLEEALLAYEKATGNRSHHRISKELVEQVQSYSKEKALYNHKVKAVRMVIYKVAEKVYDLSVEGYENYLLEAGVIVHNCPADLYYGGQYIRTQKQAKYTKPEMRPPKVRNPKQYGAFCKHTQLVMDTFPFYATTFARYLKNTYKNAIADEVEKTKKEFGMLKKAATTLKKGRGKSEEETDKKEAPEDNVKKATEGKEQEATPEEKEKHFEDRTRKHIALVQKAAKKIATANPEFKEFDEMALLTQVENHDASKFEEPERTPYIELSWRKFVGNNEADPNVNKATLHHITTNAHHPEFHLEDKSQANISKDDRDKSDIVIDATKMDALSLAEMIADWVAMSEELKTNTAREWYDEQKDVRWHFSKEQDALIDKLLAVFETDVEEGKETSKEKEFISKLESADYPDIAAHGHGFYIHWADGRAIVGYENKKDAIAFIEQGNREVVKAWYGPRDAKDIGIDDLSRVSVRKKFKPDTSERTIKEAVAVMPKSLEDRILDLESVTDVQCADGNWNYDPYMHGMANGLLLAKSIITAEEPEFKEAPDEWLSNESKELMRSIICS